MGLYVEMFTVTYAPWEYGADDRERIGEDYERTDYVSDEDETAVAHLIADMQKMGITVPSSSNYQANGRTWWSESDPYEHPHTGVLTERTLHITADDEVHRRVWVAIVGQ